MRRLLGLVLAVLGLFAALPVFAQAQDETPFARRAAQLPDILNGKTKASAYFAPGFLAQIPPEQISLIARQIEGQNGALGAVERILAETPFNGEVELGYERSLVRVQLVVSADPPHLVIGLLVTSVKPRNDSRDKLVSDIRALKGEASLLVQRLDVSEPPLLAVNPDAQLATGSTFKLWLLAEAARQVRAGERRWGDVIPLGPPALPSGMTQDWPKNAPLTLHSLATLMISISDNTATDTVLHALGRHRVDAMVERLGHSDPRRTTPVLTTIEAFALKMPSAGDLRSRWARGSVDERRRLLDSAVTRLDLSAIDRTRFGGGPLFIDSIEWFASTSDLARTMDWLRREGGKEALGILAVNVPLPPGEKARFSYAGYKGGSETGVFSMTFVFRTRQGAWYAVTGSWNNPREAVDDKRFEALIQRAVALVP